MKNKILIMCSFMLISCYSNAQKTAFDEIQEQCTGLKYDQRVRLAVSRFDVSSINSSGQLGDQFAQMLTDALQNLNCFNLLLSIKDSKVLTDEIAFGQAGNTSAGSSPSSGKMKGAHVIVLGKVTSYSTGEKKEHAFGVTASSGNIAKVGFTIQLINAETREMIASKYVYVEGKTGGFEGVKLLGVNVVGGTDNTTIQEVCRKSIVDAVEFIGSRKKDMPLPEGTTVAALKSYNASNCNVLKSGYIPRVMIILPEYHITQRIPDPAAETELNRKFTEAGFQVVDPAMYATIKDSAKFNEAAKDPAKAVSLGKKFGADIVIYGEAFSQRTGAQNDQVVCRARTEVRAVRTDDATIIASNGFEAGAIDIAEFIASKTSLKNAASLTADYLLEQFCSKDLVFSKIPDSGTKPYSEITLLNADYSKLKALSDLLAAKGDVVTKNISDGRGYIKIEHSGNTDVLADYIDSKAASKYSIQTMENGKITIMAK